MTIGEFRAFLEGMDVKDAPTPEQWARITEKLALVQESRSTPFRAPDFGRIYMGDPPGSISIPGVYTPNTCGSTQAIDPCSGASLGPSD